MDAFVSRSSIVRVIWGTSDTILFIFAGAAAEFALNKAVDWLYFTNKLPSDPLERLFSTVAYARKIVFSSETEALSAIDHITLIHKQIEGARNASIPDWAYRDVLFMLIYYSIAAYELLERKLTHTEKEEVFQVFNRVGTRMGLIDLPHSYDSWLEARTTHLQNDLYRSAYTSDLFLQYKKHLGSFRYRLLLEGQKLVVPDRVKILMDWRRFSILTPAVPVYSILKKFHLDRWVKYWLLPVKYLGQIKSLDVVDR